MIPLITVDFDYEQYLQSQKDLVEFGENGLRASGRTLKQLHKLSKDKNLVMVVPTTMYRDYLLKYMSKEYRHIFDTNCFFVLSPTSEIETINPKEISYQFTHRKVIFDHYWLYLRMIFLLDSELRKIQTIKEKFNNG